jgi:hypothetical protein
MRVNIWTFGETSFILLPTYWHNKCQLPLNLFVFCSTFDIIYTDLTGWVSSSEIERCVVRYWRFGETSLPHSRSKNKQKRRVWKRYNPQPLGLPELPSVSWSYVATDVQPASSSRRRAPCGWAPNIRSIPDKNDGNFSRQCSDRLQSPCLYRMRNERTFSTEKAVTDP